MLFLEKDFGGQQVLCDRHAIAACERYIPAPGRFGSGVLLGPSLCLPAHWAFQLNFSLLVAMRAKIDLVFLLPTY